MVILDSPPDLNILLPQEQPIDHNNKKDKDRIISGPPALTLASTEFGESSKRKRPYKLQKLQPLRPPPKSERKLKILLNQWLISLPPMN